ncbi:MAG: aldo/keto reductase [Acidobacteria bacterium]|nr:aldo/keto reductase [Acidobacteriota bacterium]
MKRRVFVGSAFAGAAAVPSRAAKVKAGDVPKRVFGKTGENLTVIGQAGGRFPLISYEDAKAVTLRAYELGLNYFDNARSYWGGRSEEVYGAVLKPFRKKVFLTTKTTKRTKQEAEAELHESLKALQTDYIDLWQIHSVAQPADVDRIFSPGGAIEAFEAAKKAGKCRFIGFTGHHDPNVHAEMLRRYQNYDTILMPLHIADPGYLSFEKIVLPEAVKRGMGIQGMKSTANAKLLQSFSVRQCLEYTLSLPIHCLAIGCTTIGQLEDDVRVAQSLKALDEPQRVALRQQAEPLKGPLLEDWKRNTLRATLARPEYLGG